MVLSTEQTGVIGGGANGLESVMIDRVTWKSLTQTAKGSPTTLVVAIAYTPCVESLFCLQSRAQLWKRRSPTPLRISLVGIRTPGVRIILHRTWQYVSAFFLSCNAALTE